jgi:ribonuclease E
VSSAPRHAAPAPARHERDEKKEVDLGEGRGRTKSSRRRRKQGREDDDEVDAETARQQAAVERDQLILVNAVDPEETRVVVEQDGKIVDLVMTVEQHTSYVNDIYRGRVVNIEDAIGAAFVDFGQGRNGFLHASDVMHIYGDEDWRLEKLLTARTEADDWEDDTRSPTDSLEEGEGKRKGGGKDKGGRSRPRGRKRKNISELLKRGQLVVAQITKDAIGDKGPTLTTYISIPGRYLVLMPSLEKTGVSRKIDDERERRRLKRILASLEIPAGMGVIVRTAGIGKTKEEIQRDLAYLLKVWESFSKNLVLGRNPAPLYQESAVAIRTMRDLFSSRTKAVIVDDEKVYHEMREFTQNLMPEHLDRIILHDGARPLFHSHGIEPDFEKLFARRVELPSGGSIVFDQTEALVAIDVNSGRTRDEGADFEDIALKANLEAVPEIARQIKLRDLGGIIVVDFIDMMRPASRRKVEKAFCARLDEDRARNKVGRISQFGLLELTRQRLGPGLSKLLYEPCAYCRGTGRRRTAQSKAQAVLRRLGSALTQKGFTKIEILVHPDTLDWLKKHDWKEVMELEQKSARELVFIAAEDQHEDSVFHYLRADGREVRPGGRRRR